MSEIESESKNQSEFDTGEGWHKLSPWSVLHYIARRHNVITSSMIGALALGVASDGNSIKIVFSIGLLLVFLFAIVAVFEYRFFSYQLIDDAVQIRQGVFFKKKLNLKFKRTQNANIIHPFFFRPLGLVTLKIDGAGSAGEEVYISALTLDRASEIRQTIKQRLAQVDKPEAESEISLLEEDLFFTRSLTDLIIHGLTNNRAWLIVGGLAGLISTTPISYDDIFALLGRVISPLINNESLAYLAVLFIISLFLTVAITALLSVIGSIVTYYGFSLFRSKESVTVHRGLINKQEINMRKSRVQTVYIRQDWLDRVLGRVNLIFEQISHKASGSQNRDSGKRLLVPSARIHEIPELLREILPLQNPRALTFTPISKRYFYKFAAIWTVVYILAVAGIGLARPEWTNYLLLALPLWLVHCTMLYLNWKRAGLTIEKDIVVARSGIFGIDYVLFPAHKLQDISNVQSLLMKRHDLSNILLSTASRRIKVPYLPTELVKNTMDYCLYCAESTDRSWM